MATYIQFKVKGKKVFIELWHDTEFKEMGGLVYKCGSEQTSEALKGYTIKDADGNVLATISDHGFKCSYDNMHLYIELFDAAGVKQKLKLYYDRDDTAKYRHPVVMEA